MSDDIRLRHDFVPGGDLRDELWGKVMPSGALVLQALAVEGGIVQREACVGFTAADARRLRDWLRERYPEETTNG